MAESGIVAMVLFVEAVIACLVFLVARARGAVCRWDLKTTRRRLYLGSAVTALAAILTLLTWPNLFANLAQSANPSVEIAGTIGGVIGATMADPRQWAGWIGFYWVVLAMRRKRQLQKLGRDASN